MLVNRFFIGFGLLVHFSLFIGKSRTNRPSAEAGKGPRKGVSFHYPGDYFFSIVLSGQQPK